jgi:hypothetical protein
VAGFVSDESEDVNNDGLVASGRRRGGVAMEAVRRAFAVLLHTSVFGKAFGGLRSLDNPDSSHYDKRYRPAMRLGEM